MTPCICEAVQRQIVRAMKGRRAFRWRRRGRDVEHGFRGFDPLNVRPLMLQRRLRIGYNRAARLMEDLKIVASWGQKTGRVLEKSSLI